MGGGKQMGGGGTVCDAPRQCRQYVPCYGALFRCFVRVLCCQLTPWIMGGTIVAVGRNIDCVKFGTLYIRLDTLPDALLLPAASSCKYEKNARGDWDMLSEKHYLKTGLQIT